MIQNSETVQAVQKLSRPPGRRPVELKINTHTHTHTHTATSPQRTQSLKLTLKHKKEVTGQN